MTSTFHGPLDAHIAIPAPHCGPGGTMNFNFGSGRADNGLPASYRQLEPFSTVPFAPDPDYVDRPDILAWVRDKCAGNGARAALVGLGGVGKSQIAIRYAHSIRDASPQTFVFWVHASTRARFEEAYKDIADRLQLPGRDDPKANVLQLVRNWLWDETNGQWFMVLDNVDDVETFFPSRKRKRHETDTDSPASLTAYLPQSRNGAILVTSRSKDAASSLVDGHNKIHEVLAMSTGEGLQLLRNKLCNPLLQESALELLQALECIPLAIIQASAYMNRRANMTVARYLDDFQKNDKKREGLLKWDTVELRRDQSASNSILTTWQMSFKQIRSERPSAAELLALMSFFDPQGIPEWTLRRFRKYTLNGTATDDSEDEDCGLGDDLATLQAYSLVSMTADNVYDMHALVQFCMRAWLSSSGDVERWEEEFVDLMAQELPYQGYKDWAKWHQLIPHIVRLFDSMPSSQETLVSWARVLAGAAQVMYDHGDYDAAERFTAKALDVEVKILGPSDIQTLDTMDQLAILCQVQGDHEDAVKLGQHVLETRTRVLGECHPDTLNAMRRLAIVLSHEGKYHEAGDLYQKALEACKTEPGKNSRLRLLLLASIASSIESQGKYHHAERLCREVVEVCKKLLGEKDRLTLSALGDLATVIYRQKRYSEAEKLYWEVVEGSKEEQGDNLYILLPALTRLSSLLWDRGDLTKSERTSRLAIETCSQVLGEQHPNTLVLTFSLGVCLHKLQKFTEATELCQRACDGLTKELGSQHRDTIFFLKRFAEIQKEKEKSRTSEEETHSQSAEESL